MKLKVLAAIVMTGLAGSAFGQSLVLDNSANSGASSTATSGGLLWEQSGTNAPTLFDGFNHNVGAEVFGGPNAGTLTPMGVFTPATDSKGYTGLDVGKFQLGGAGVAVAVPGVASGGLATILLNIWDYDSPNATGTFSSYAAAVAGNDPHGSAEFQNATSSTSPPLPAGPLTGMPAIIMTVPVPEPSTIALAGLGAAALLAIRRRK